jgi:glutathione S-transferase
VPKAEGVVITKSVAIMAFLESAYPTPPLFGETPAEIGLIWQPIFEVINTSAIQSRRASSGNLRTVKPSKTPKPRVLLQFSNRQTWLARRRIYPATVLRRQQDLSG